MCEDHKSEGKNEYTICSEGSVSCRLGNGEFRKMIPSSCFSKYTTKIASTNRISEHAYILSRSFQNLYDIKVENT